MRALPTLACAVSLSMWGCGTDHGASASTTGQGGATNGVGGSGSSTAGDGGSGEDGGSTGGASLGAYPVDPSPVSRGGTMTFSNIGAPGWWPRRLDRAPGDPGCDYKDGTDTWGGACCMTKHETTSTTLAPFDEEMSLILKAVKIRQLAVYQPDSGHGQGAWPRVSWWDARDAVAHNLWFTQNGSADGSTDFPGDLTGDDCNWYVMQEPVFECGDGADYYCPADPGINHLGWKGSKLIVFLGSMTFDDSSVKECGGTAPGHPGPWVAFDASELFRDGARKWDGQCNCYSKTGTIGDGCGEINVFEVVLDNNQYSNREFISTGVRSFQAGHVGGSVCGADCHPADFPSDSEVIDACAGVAYSHGPELIAGGTSDGCPVWRRPVGDRYFMILLDEATRTIQVAVIHPQNIPASAAALLPDLPDAIGRPAIDALATMRLPEEGQP